MPCSDPFLLLHAGNARLSDLVIDEAGRVVVVDPKG
jgi:hypothetical protein